MRYIALIIGKLASLLLKLIGRHGGSFPGRVALVFCKDILKYFKYPDITILVTGTNGKTSTSNLIAGTFREAGYDVISNSRGDNIIFGIASLLIKNAGFDFVIDSEVLVLEVDELTLARHFKDISATDLVVTNFFRDQLDRAGEMETIINKISHAIKDYDKNIYLNEDDPNVKRMGYAAKNANLISFGLDRLADASETNHEAKEGKFCFNCNGELQYDYYQYSHIGSYHCSSCEFGSSRPDYFMTNINEEALSFDILTKDEKTYSLNSNIDAAYHLYNLVAASSVSLNYGIDVEKINRVFANFNLGIGRMENISIDGKDVLLNLVKNPTGFNEILKYINKYKEDKSMIFVLNDNVQDGTDTSWIWDAEFEKIDGLSTVILSGKRAYEAALRFKIAEIDTEIVVEKDFSKALDRLMKTEAKKYVISTYTALFSSRAVMLARADKD